MKTYHQNVYANPFSWLENVWEKGAGRDIFYQTSPAMNIKNLEGGYEVELAAPGLTKEAFKLSIEENMLHISVQLEEKEDISYKRREFSFGKFKRSLQLSKEIDTDAIKAVYENGILRIELPKKTDLAKGNRNIVIE